jgi:hypothetical protein
MALARTDVTPRDFVATRSSTARPSFWRKLYVAMLASRQRAAEREIALYLHTIGGKFTDDAEREIERRFLGQSRR